MCAVVNPNVFASVLNPRESVIADTLRIIAENSSGTQETAIADTSRRIVENIRADTLRIVVRQDSTAADTVIRVPHVLNYFAQNNSFKNYDVTSFEVTLNERTLSDTFSLSTAQTLDINAAVKGRFLDYPFSFLVEESSQQDLIQTVKGMYDIDKLLYMHIDLSGLVYYRNGDTSEITAAISLGYITHEKTDTATVICARASDIMYRLGTALGLPINAKFADFTPYNFAAEHNNITYSDLISSLFSWTSRLPQRQINVFLRDGILHCIQRGMEDSTFDITNLPHSRPIINKKMLRTMYNNPFGSSEINKKGKDDPEVSSDWTENDIAEPFSGTIAFENRDARTSLTYSNGLLRKEYSSLSNGDADSYSNTVYNYIEIFPEGTTELQIFLHKLSGDFYMSSKSTGNTTIQYGDKPTDNEKVVTSSQTDFYYVQSKGDNVYLAEEFETSEKSKYTRKKSQTTGELVWTLADYDTHTRQTIHTPVGNGWYNTSVYVDGEIQGSSLSQGKPGNKISLYTINEVQKTFTVTVANSDNGDGDESGSSGDESGSSGDKYAERRNKLSAIADTSFPVRELNLIRELTDDLYWLNRKTQENVTVEIIDRIVNGVPSINHIVDFTERVIFNGNQYFLVSNQVSFTPRKLIQKLQLVRWY